MSTVRPVILAFIGLVVSFQVAAAEVPRFYTLGHLPDGKNTLAFGLSGDGSTVVGFSSSASREEAFRWREADGLLGLGDLQGAAFRSRAFAASEDGSVVVGDGESSPGRRQAFRWTASGGMQGLGFLPGGWFESVARATSAFGDVVVGQSRTDSGEEAFRWTSITGMQGLGDFPGGLYSSIAQDVTSDGAVICGQGWSDLGPEAFRWDASGGVQGLGDLPGGEYLSGATAMNSDGSVIAGFGNTGPGLEGFIWTSAGGMESLGDLPGGRVQCIPLDVSDDGSIVVGYDVFDETRTDAFLWQRGTGMRRLEDVLTEFGIDMSGWLLTDATGISRDGTTITGYGIGPFGLTEAWVAVIPDPATAPMVAIALVAVLQRRENRCD